MGLRHTSANREPYSSRVFVFDVVDIQLLRCLDLCFRPMFEVDRVNRKDGAATLKMLIATSFRDEKSLTIGQAPSVIQHDVEPDLAIQFPHHACCQMSPRSRVTYQCENYFNTLLDSRQVKISCAPQEQNSE